MDFRLCAVVLSFLFAGGEAAMDTVRLDCDFPTDLYWYSEFFLFRCDFLIGEMTAASGSATMEVGVTSLSVAVLLMAQKSVGQMGWENVVLNSCDMLKKRRS